MHIYLYHTIIYIKMCIYVHIYIYMYIPLGGSKKLTIASDLPKISNIWVTPEASKDLGAFIATKSLIQKKESQAISHAVRLVEHNYNLLSEDFQSFCCFVRFREIQEKILIF